jgi:hypothetical protein
MDSGYDVLTFLGEFRETARMVAGAIPKIISLVKRGREKRLRLRDPIGLWLEARYGVRPLISDIESIIELWLHRDRPRYRASAAAAYSQVFTSQTSVGDGASWYGTYNAIHECTVSGKATGISKIEPPRLKLDPIQAGWELLPFSFIVDWFVSVGTTLSALHTQAIRPDLVMGVGYEIRCSTTADLVDVGTFNGWQGAVGTHFSGTLVLRNRSAASPGIMPSLTLKLDYFKIADLLAIMYQLLQKYR